MKLSLGPCGFCDGQGEVHVRVSDSGSCIFGMCDECFYVWRDKTMQEDPFSLDTPPRGVTAEQYAQWTQIREPSHWANMEEVIRFGWGDVVRV